MLNFITNYLYLCLSLIGIFFFLYTYVVNKLFVNFFDPILILNVTNAIFSSVILILFYEGYIQTETFIFYIIFITSFYFFLFISTIKIKIPNSPNVFKNISIFNWKINFIVSSLIILISIICNFLFSYLMINQGFEGTERLVLRKDNIVLDLIRRDAGTVGFILQGLSLSFLRTSVKNQIIWPIITLTGLILFSLSGVFSGNKALFFGAILQLSIGYFFF